MKNSKTCPKCESKNILLIPGSTRQSTGNAISTNIFGFTSVLITRFLCEDCGYSEEWVQKKEDITVLKKKYKRHK